MTDDLKEKVIAAAVLVDEPNGWLAMRSGVTAMVRQLDLPMLEQLARNLDNASAVPTEFRPEQREPGRALAWSLLWTETGCEIFYQCGAQGIAALRTVAFADSDVGYGTAFYLLCRLAAQGLEREQFIEDVRHAFPQVARETQMLMVDAVLRQGVRVDDCIGRDISRNDEFAAVVAQFESLDGWHEAREQLSALD